MRIRALTSLGYDAGSVDPQEIDGLTGWLYRTLGGSGVRSQQDVKYMIQSRELTGGNTTPFGLKAGEHIQGEVNPVMKAESEVVVCCSPAFWNQ